MGRRTKFLITFIIPVLVVAAAFYWFGRFTVASDEKLVHYSQIGYKLEKYAFRSQCVLKLWKSSSDEGEMELSYTIPDCHGSPKVVESKWLASNQILYLHIVRNGFSYSYNFMGEKKTDWVPDIPIKILYDFRRGAMYLTSSSTLWRVDDPSGYGQPGFMTEEEFRDIYDELTQVW